MREAINIDFCLDRGRHIDQERFQATKQITIEGSLAGLEENLVSGFVERMVAEATYF